MGTYLGGSAPAMANQVCAGYTLLSPTILKRLSVDQMRSLEFEIDKRLRETRADQVDLKDMDAVRDRNRRVSRIDGALRVLRHAMQQKKMGRL
jgi:hypothetical protein